MAVNYASKLLNSLPTHRFGTLICVCSVGLITCSVSAQAPVFRSISAAAEDVAKQLEQKAKEDPAYGKYIFYDPRISDELSALKAFQGKLKELQRLRQELRDTSPFPVGAQEPPDVRHDVRDYFRQQMAVARAIAESQIQVKGGDKSKQHDASLQTFLTSYDADREDVRVVLDKLFHSVGVSCVIDPSVKGIVTFSLKNTTFETTLNSILRQVDATYRVEEGVYQIIKTTDVRDARSRFLSAVPSAESPDALAVLVGALSGLPDSSGTSRELPHRSAADTLAMDALVKRTSGSFFDPSVLSITERDVKDPLQDLIALNLAIHSDAVNQQTAQRLQISNLISALEGQYRTDSFWKKYGCIAKVLEEGSALANGQGAMTLETLRSDVSKAKKELGVQGKLGQELERYSRDLARISNLRTLPKVVGTESQRLIDQAVEVWAIYIPSTSADISAAKTMLEKTGLSTDEFEHAGMRAVDSAIQSIDTLGGFTDTVEVLALIRKTLEGGEAQFKRYASLIQLTETYSAQLGAKSPVKAGLRADAHSANLIRALQTQAKLDKGYRILRLGVETSAEVSVDVKKTSKANLDSAAAFAEVSFTVFDAEGKICLGGSSIAYLPQQAKSDLRMEKPQVVRG